MCRGAARPADPCPVSFDLLRDTLSKRSGAAADSAGGTATVKEVSVCLPLYQHRCWLFLSQNNYKRNTDTKGATDNTASILYIKYFILRYFWLTLLSFKINIFYTDKQGWCEHKLIKTRERTVSNVHVIAFRALDWVKRGLDIFFISLYGHYGPPYISFVGPFSHLARYCSNHGSTVPNHPSDVFVTLIFQLFLLFFVTAISSFPWLQFCAPHWHGV